MKGIEWEGNSNVQPRKRQRPKPRPWYCLCESALRVGGLAVAYLERPGSWVRCPDCGTERPA